MTARPRNSLEYHMLEATIQLTAKKMAEERQAIVNKQRHK